VEVKRGGSAYGDQGCRTECMEENMERRTWEESKVTAFNRLGREEATELIIAKSPRYR